MSRQHWVHAYCVRAVHPQSVLHLLKLALCRCIKEYIPFHLSSAPKKLNFFSLIMNLTVLGTSWRWNCTIFVCSYLHGLTQHTRWPQGSHSSLEVQDFTPFRKLNSSYTRGHMRSIFCVSVHLTLGTGLCPHHLAIVNETAVDVGVRYVWASAFDSFGNS